MRDNQLIDTRRRLLLSGSLVAAGTGLWPQFRLRAADETALSPLNRAPRMMQEYYVQRLRAMDRRRQQEHNALRTADDARQYVERVRAKVRRSFGPLPQRTPLEPQVTGTVDRDAYTIEKVIFHSRPNFPVTANLYVPKKLSGPAPGVVGSCGHSVNGKAAEAYQSFAQGLARLGYVCLIFDPIGQGERLQYADEKLAPRHGTGTGEHIYAGNQQFLVGDFFGAWRAWDGIRALDYLLSRPEVDPKHVGITGNSGGGTMTTWLCGVEDRWSMAAPSCFVTTFLRNLENELPADTEQCPPMALALGLDHADFIACMAPKPVVLLGQEQDFFDARGLEEAHARLKRLYGLLGAEDNIRLFMGPTVHGYSIDNREAMYRWFNRATGRDENVVEPKIEIEKDETLWCTPHGQIAELKPRTVFSFTREKSQALAAQRGTMPAATLAPAIENVLRLPKREGVADYRILRPNRSRGWPKQGVSVYALETEPGIQIVVYRLAQNSLVSRPRGVGQALLYISHESADAELRGEPLVRELIAGQPDAVLYACDVRGIGESRPNTCGENSFASAYGCDYFYAAHGLMLDRPYLGQKTLDVLRVVDWLKAIGHADVHLAALGWGALAGTFASVLHPDIARVTLKHALSSYATVAETEEYRWPLATLPHGVLARFDLPDCYAALGVKRLRQIEPWGALADNG